MFSPPTVRLAAALPWIPACAMVLVGVGCGADAEGAPATARALAPVSGVPAGTVRFECGAGQRVDIAAGGARIALPDGRVVVLPAVGTDAYRGETLSFVVTADRGALSQDAAGTTACMRAV